MAPTGDGGSDPRDQPIKLIVDPDFEVTPEMARAALRLLESVARRKGWVEE